MKTLFALFTISAFMFTGCYPQAVVLWSHDGQHGAVLTKDRIYFCDPQGELSKESLPGGGPAAWASNSNDFYYATRLPLGSWKEAAEYLSDAEQKRLISLAKDSLANLKPGELNDEKTNPFMRMNGENIALTLLYLRDNHADEFKSKLNKRQQQDFMGSNLKANLYQLFACKNCDWSKSKLILQTFRELGAELRPSPNGKAVTLIMSAKNNFSIYVCDMDGKLRLVAENAAMYPGWTPDGKSLVYSSENSGIGNPKNLKLGSIKRVTIFDKDNRMLKKFPEPKELAGVLFHETCNIRCLNNGWIIFSSAQLKLPATEKQMPQTQSLFAIIPELQSMVINIIPEETNRYFDNPSWDTFQMSPDQKKMAVLLKNYQVAILSLGTWDNEIVPFELEGMDNFLPTWQGNNHICLLNGKKDKSGKIHASVTLKFVGKKPKESHWLYPAPKENIISKDWPESVMQSIIEKYKKDNETKPAQTQPAQTQPAKNDKSQ